MPWLATRSDVAADVAAQLAQVRLRAVALVRPSRSLQDLETKSVRKKWKDKAFARGVNREVIEKGSELLDIPIETLIEQTILALRPVEKEIGLGS